MPSFKSLQIILIWLYHLLTTKTILYSASQCFYQTKSLNTLIFPFEEFWQICALCACVFRHVQLFVTPWTVAHQPPLSMRLPRQEYWSGLAFPPPGYFPDPGIEPASPTSPALEGRFFTTSTTWEAQMYTPINLIPQSRYSSYTLFWFPSHRWDRTILELLIKVNL